MQKMRCESRDLTQANIEKIAELFPSVITETRDEQGWLRKAVNFEALRQLLSSDVVVGEEAYEFTWPGKKAAIVEAGRPIRKTLRPCPEESRDWDTTENLYIEGDNLEVLKLLQENYLGRVRMIYIDPPYNTGNDFIYRDDFAMSREDWQEETGETEEDEEGERQRLFRNTDSNGRFHSDWCSMIYPRLMLARNLLSDDGVIFISCDDNEIENLKRICNEIFGEDNFIGTVVWKKKTNGNNMGLIPSVHDYILSWGKSKTEICNLGYPVTAEHIAANYSNEDDDPRGAWTTMDLSANHKGPFFPIKNPNTGEEFYPPQGRYWVFNESEVNQRIADGRIIFGKSGKSRPVQKVFASERLGGCIRAESWWDQHGMNEDATAEFKEIFHNGKLMSHPKPSKLLYNLAKISTCGVSDSLILDFFSGSATTAHAVMQLNAEDGGNRKFIMVQLPEECAPGSEAAKAGYRNICEIGKERIRRAGDRIKAENPLNAGNLDIGFRALKCDSSNMKDVYYTPRDTDQAGLDGLISNIKPDRTDLDLLFGCLVEWGLPLSLPCRTEEIGGFPVHFYDCAEGEAPALAACFAANISEAAISEIARRKPLRAVFRDSGFADSQSRINAAELFKNQSPDTAVRVL